MADNSLDAKQHEALPPLASLLASGFILDSRPREQQLDPTQPQIRILRLLRGFWTDPIRCNTFVAYLRDNPVYTALSYAWGNEPPLREIMLNGVQFFVTPNLFSALRRLRKPDVERDLWIDAICINQEDNAEKSHQVQLMGTIFSMATDGIMWLGDYIEPSLASDPKLSPLVTYAERGKISWIYAAHDFACISRLANNAHLEAHDTGTETSYRSETPDRASSLESIMTLSWWERAWTVQEVVLVPSVTFQCGSFSIGLEAVEKAKNNYMRHTTYTRCCKTDSRRQYGLNMMSTQINMIMMMRNYRSEVYDFVDALDVVRRRHASDKRDKVYSLFGLYPTGLTPLSVDYSLTETEVCRKTLLELIQNSGDLLPFLRGIETDRNPILPSWVPDWCNTSKTYESITHDLSHYRHHSAANSRRAAIVEISWRTISLLGHFVDYIARITRNNFEEDALDELSVPWRSSPAYPWGGSYSDAFQKVADSCWGNNNGAYVYFVTERGLLGAALHDVRIRDPVYLLFGGNVPFVLRPSSADIPYPAHTYVSHSYIQGIMQGEAMNDDSEGQWVFLV